MRNSETAPPCPQCGTNRSIILERRWGKLTNATTRKRKGANNHRFTTVETVWEPDRKPALTQ